MNNTIVSNGNDFNVIAKNTLTSFEGRDPDWRPSITWMNMSGDVTITWDDQNKEAILEYAREKMTEGYSFYILKPKKMFGFEREAKQKVTAKNFDKLAEGSRGIVIPDAALNDLLQSGRAKLKDGQKGDRKHEIARRVKDPKELLDHDTVAMKPLVGG